MELSTLIYALLAAVFAALVGIFGKIGLKELDANTATALRSIIMAIFLVGVVFVQGKWNHVQDIISNHKGLTMIIFSGIAGALSWLFYFMALKNGKVVQVAPIDKLSVVFAGIFAIVFLHEKVSLINGFGFIFITIGVIMVALG